MKSKQPKNLEGYTYPHSEESEAGLIGLMLLDNNTIPSILELITAEHFHNIKYRTIFKSIISLFEQGASIDPVTLKNALNKDRTVGQKISIEELIMLIEKAPLETHLKDYCLIILEKYLKRKMMEIGGEMVAECSRDEVDALESLDKAQNLLFQLAQERYKHNFINFRQLLHHSVDKIMRLKEIGGVGTTGVATGILELDRYLGGLQNSDLIIVAGRPSMGKTALAITIAHNIAVLVKKPIGFFSIEMSAEQIMLRLIALSSGIGYYKLRMGALSENEVNHLLLSMNDLMTTRFLIDDTPAINLLELTAKARRLKFEYDICALFVDYMQLINVKAESREREIALISRTLKQLAKELNIPVVAISQLNRSLENRADKRPQLSDLRESGSIEQDADIVIFVYRPEVYGINKWPDGSGDDVQGKAEIIISKHRNGAIGSFKLLYLKEVMKFSNLYVLKSDFSEDDLGFQNETAD